MKARSKAAPDVGRATRRRIVDAALRTLKRDGYAGASARAIARTGRFNPALIFYHFGSVHDLLLAAVDETSRVRMNRYEKLLADVTTLPDLMRSAAALYREDLKSGHITVVAEMIAGASSVPELGPEIVERIQPWIALTEEVIERVLRGTILEPLARPADLAFAVVALYLGLELLTHLEGDPARAEPIFALAAQVAALVSGVGIDGAS